MAQRVFIAQTNFLIPLKGLGKEYLGKLKREGAPIKDPFCVKKHGMQCVCYFVDVHDFYFRSFPNDSFNCVFHKIALKAYVLSFSINHKSKKKKYFMAVSAKADKCFTETHVKDATGYQRLPSFAVCTDRDLIYLQKAFYEDKDEKGNWKGFFYPLQDPTSNHKAWINRLVAKVEESKSRQVDFEYSAIRAFSADIDLAALPVVDANTLTKAMTDAYYLPGYPDFDAYWKGDDARFAACLISGNDNIGNVSDSCIEASFKESYSKNKYERIYAGESGIVFLQTHHPFDLTAEEEEKRQRGQLSIHWPDGVDGSQCINELCSALFFKDWLGRLRRRLDEERIADIKNALAGLANYLGMEYAHLAAIDEKYRFVYRQMGIVSVFVQLTQEADLRFQSYSLILSTRFNRLMLWVAVVAFLPAVLQIIQNYLYNLKSSSMKDCDITIRVVDDHSHSCGCCCDSQVSCPDPVMVTLLVLLVIIILVIMHNCVLMPHIKKLHKQFHREMEDEQ